MDAESHPQGPNLLHFSQAQLTDVDKQQSQAWDTIITNNVKLPSPYIRLYDKDGNFIGNKSFIAEQVHNQPQPSDSELLSPQTTPTQVPEEPSTLETQLCVTQTNHGPVHVATPVSNSTSVINGEFTPSLASLIQPVTLFKPHSCSPSECPPQPSLMEVSTCTQESGEIYDDDLLAADVHSDNENKYHTKAAKLIEKSLGRTSELDMFDKLRAAMKGKMHRQQKPTRHQQQQYQEISAKLNTRLIAVKYDLKLQVKNYEKMFHKTHGTFPDQENDTEYRSLRTKLDDTKKLCHFWNACITL